MHDRVAASLRAGDRRGGIDSTQIEGYCARDSSRGFVKPPADAYHLVATLEQMRTDDCADVAARTGHQHPHDLNPQRSISIAAEPGSANSPSRRSTATASAGTYNSFQ